MKVSSHLYMYPWISDDDPFTLKKWSGTPEWMDPFFDDLSFNEHRFRHFLLGAVETTAMNILDEQQYKCNAF